MTDFVLKRVNTPLAGQQVSSVRHHELEKYRQIFKYAKFLKKPLKLEMFVPCDEDGNILEEPDCNLDIRVYEMKEYYRCNK